MSESIGLVAKAKVIVITGGTGGIGFQEALMLAALPEKHTIVINGRTETTGKAAVEKIKSATSNDSIHLCV